MLCAIQISFSSNFPKMIKPLSMFQFHLISNFKIESNPQENYYFCGF